MNDNQRARISWIELNKCATENCWNFNAHSSDYCNKCKYSPPIKMNEKDIALLKQHRKNKKN